MSVDAGERVNASDLQNLCPELYGWLSALYPGTDSSAWLEDVLLVKTYQDGRLTVEFCTDDHRYHIYHNKSEGSGGLLFSAHSRKPLVGEDHSRGRDLNDGPLSEETWNKFLREVIHFEIVGRSSGG